MENILGPRILVPLLALSILWGGSFFFVGVAVGDLPPFTIVALRVGLAALGLGAVVLLAGERMLFERPIWLAFAVMGLINNAVPFTLIVWGQTHIASGLASILNATTPLFGVIVAHVLTHDEKMTGARVVGVVVGIAGVVLVIGPDAVQGLRTNIAAQLAILGAALSYAFAGVFGRRFQRAGIRPLASATGQLTASTLILLPLALAIDQPWTLAMPSGQTWAAIVGLALLSTSLAYLIYFHILAIAGATNILLVTLLIPVSAILLGGLFLGEQLAVRHFAGMGVIGLSLIVIDGRILRRMRGGRSSQVPPS
jgi:drug/metabolite transporter (DMT)-like permease